MTLSWRRVRNFLIAVLAAASVFGITHLYELSLHDASYFDGWILLVSVVFLALFNSRKKMSMLPLVPARFWTVVHVGVGWFVILVFLNHTGFRWPNGLVETALWVAFVLVALSGVFGAYISMSAPSRLSRHGDAEGKRRHGERVIFERIPGYRAELAARAEEVATRSLSELKSTIIADYYTARLASFFRQPRNFFMHLFESDRAHAAMRDEMQALDRYLDDRGRAILGEIRALVAAKDNLDYYYALQLTLKAWLFVHIPLTYVLLILVTVHALLAYGFSVGAP